MTRADRFRRMRDNELVQFMFEVFDCCNCPASDDGCVERCTERIEEWLKEDDE